MISIVIPAHNEAQVIRRCLDGLCTGAKPGELEVIVVCNGCSDDTADIVRKYDGPVRVIEVTEPGKWRALNAGDQAAIGFPRFYIDADIIISLDTVRRVARVLDEGSALAAAPRMMIDLTGCPRSVRGFYDIWLQTPYSTSGMIGSGVYAVSRAGRARFHDFPPITGDDTFVRLHFNSSERVTVSECEFIISPPRNLSGLIKIKTRAHFGTLELYRYRADLFANEEARHSRFLLALLRRPRNWFPVGVYTYVRILSRILAWRKLRFGGARWERDDTSRDWAERSYNE